MSDLVEQAMTAYVSRRLDLLQQQIKFVPLNFKPGQILELPREIRLRKIDLDLPKPNRVLKFWNQKHKLSSHQHECRSFR